MDKMEEERILRVMFVKSGAGNITPRITLPAVWVREMGINDNDRKVKVSFENNKIIIEKFD